MARPKITLYVDTVSPFAYYGYWILRNSAAFKDVDIHIVPIFLGGLMHKCGNTAPIKIKNKDKWINVERLRWARAFNIPVIPEMPPNFPPNTLPVQRVLAAIYAAESTDTTAAQPKLTAALDALFGAFWVKGQAVHEGEVLKRVLEGVFGEEGEKHLAAANAPAIKAVLTANTDRAFDDGAFGLPWFTCTNSEGKTEGFWGIDHLGQVAQFLGMDMKEEGPKDGAVNRRGWKAVL